MSPTCAIYTCKNLSRALCHCCQQNICLYHLQEHENILNSKLDPLIDKINLLTEQLQTIDIEKKVRYCHQKLEQWREDCYKKIDQLFEEKSRELNQLLTVKIHKQQEELNDISNKLTKLIKNHQTTKEDINLLQSNIHLLEGKIHNIEKLSFYPHIDPLILNINSINFKEQNQEKIDISIDYPIYKTIDHIPGSWFPLASNDHFLLFHQIPNLCLINRDLTIIKQIPWSYPMIADICWSSTFNGFLILTHKTLYFLNEKTMSIERLFNTSKENWFTCTCSNSSLFVSTCDTGSSIYQYKLSFSIDLIKKYDPPKPCGNYECIDMMICNNETLGLLIRNRFERFIRIELRFSETFDCIWSCKIDRLRNLNTRFHGCLLSCDEWLIINPENQQLIQITKFGILKTTVTYKKIPRFINQFGEHFLVIVTDNGLNFHKLNLNN